MNHQLGELQHQVEISRPEELVLVSTEGVTVSIVSESMETQPPRDEIPEGTSVKTEASQQEFESDSLPVTQSDWMVPAARPEILDWPFLDIQSQANDAVVAAIEDESVGELAAPNEQPIPRRATTRPGSYELAASGRIAA